jgi:cell division FtsZ-interacting protein ZapD
MEDHKSAVRMVVELPGTQDEFTLPDFHVSRHDALRSQDCQPVQTSTGWVNINTPIRLSVRINPIAIGRCSRHAPPTNRASHSSAGFALIASA